MSNCHRVLLRWGLTLGLLGLLFWQLDLGAVTDTLLAIPLWLLVPVGVLVVLQVVISAWRWRYTAAALGLTIPAGVAFREYYLATCLNQLLPGGVVGDVNRAWRQGLRSGLKLAAVHSVMIERLSGQLMLGVMAVVGAVAYLPNVLRLTESKAGPWLIALTILAIVAALLLRKRLPVYLSLLRKDLRGALLGWRNLSVHLISSALVVSAYLGVFLVLAAGQGNWAGTGSPGLLMALCSLLLLAMVIPVTVAGWGVREGVAAALWPLAGLPAEQGVALGIAYGVVNLLWSLPGGLLALTACEETPDQTTYRSPG